MPSTRTAVRTGPCSRTRLPGRPLPSGGVVGVPESPASVLDPLETDVELDGDLVLELQRAEESRVRGDAEVRLPYRGAAAEMSGSGAGDLQPERPRRAAQCERALDRAAMG